MAYITLVNITLLLLLLSRSKNINYKVPILLYYYLIDLAKRIIL